MLNKYVTTNVDLDFDLDFLNWVLQNKKQTVKTNVQQLYSNVQGSLAKHKTGKAQNVQSTCRINEPSFGLVNNQIRNVR